MAFDPPLRPKGGTTPEDLLDIEDGHRFELIDADLVERNFGQLSSAIGLKALSPFASAGRAGVVTQADCGFQIFPNAATVRFADGSYTASNRLPGGQPYKGHSRVAPDFALEVTAREIL